MKPNLNESTLDREIRGPPLYASLVGVRAALGGLRDLDTVVEDAIAGRIRTRRATEFGARELR